MRDMLKPALTFVCLALAACGPGATPEVADEIGAAATDTALLPFAQVQAPDLDEGSGLVKVGASWFAIEDSGAPPMLWRGATPAFEQPEILRVPSAVNVDWEEVTSIDGDLLVCDVGDNSRRRTDCTLYRVRFVPGAMGAASRLDLVATYPVAWPDGPHDCEALFVLGGKVHAITKDRGDGTRVYRFDTLRDAADLGTARNTAVEIGRLALGGPDDREMATGACVAPAGGGSGEEVIVLTYTQIAAYPASRLDGAPARSITIGARQAEAVAAEERNGDVDLVFTNEQRDVFRIERFRSAKAARMLPPRGAAGLVAETATAIALQGAAPGESAHWVRERDALHVTVRMLTKLPDGLVPADPEKNRPGTGVLLCFGREPRRHTTEAEVILALATGKDGAGRADRIVWTDRQRVVPAEGATVTVRKDGDFVLFEARIPFALAFGSSAAPERFLFNVMPYQTGRDEYFMHSGPVDLFTLIRPYLWGDATSR
ncbi:MAG: hypothetical protein HMLKMBBP_00906 [Planctomycetes bacterium]|nr:hypothetical protein [Planctomycetota bacterium]